MFQHRCLDTGHQSPNASTGVGHFRGHIGGQVRHPLQTWAGEHGLTTIHGYTQLVGWLAGLVVHSPVKKHRKPSCSLHGSYIRGIPNDFKRRTLQ